MRRKLAQAATTTMLTAALITGGTVAAAAPAIAQPAHQAQAQTQVREPVWVHYKSYATHEACRQQGREMLNGGVVIGYDCRWGSPYWSLWVRIQ